MTNKNPFEIRLDVLKMAQEMMDRELELNTQQYYHQVEAVKQTNIGNLQSTVQNAPKMYSPEDIIAKASALYGFVSDSSTTASTRAIRSSSSDIEDKYRK